MKIQAARQLLTILLVVVNYDVIQCDEGTLKLSTLSEGMFFKLNIFKTQLLMFFIISKLIKSRISFLGYNLYLSKVYYIKCIKFNKLRTNI